jgi:micrococcal nuclease
MYYNMKYEPYVYKIKGIIKIVDGDTVDLLIDLGFDTYIEKRIRLYGINTPETRTRDLEEKEKGLAAKSRLEELCELSNNESLILKSYGTGKYGRVLGELIKNGEVLNDILLAEGHAKKY